MSYFEEFLRNQEELLDFSCKLDANKLRRHILDCLGAFYLLQRKERSINTAESKLFYIAVIMIAENALDAYESFKSEGYLFSDNSPVQEVIKSRFSKSAVNRAPSDLPSGDWSSVAWAAVAGDRLSEDEANSLFKHGSPTDFPSQGMQLARFAAGAKRPHMSFLKRVLGLLPYLATTRDSGGLLPLHYAARFTESCDVINYLLQFQATPIDEEEGNVNSSQSIVRAGHGSEVVTPLLCLLQREIPAENAVDMVKSILTADPASAKVADTNQYTPLHHACRNIKAGLATIVDALLSVAPELAAASTNDGITALHCLFDSDSKPSVESTAVVKSILAIDSKVALMTNAFGDLPIHYAAAYGSTEDVRLLVQAFPDTVTASNRVGKIPLYLAVKRADEEAVGVIKLLHSLYPQAICLPDGESSSFLPLHIACTSQASIRTVTTVCDLYPAACRVKNKFGELPLSTFLGRYRRQSDESRTEGIARLLLKHYPAAAETCGVPDNTFTTSSSYALAVEKGLPEHVRRLLLRAAPGLNRDEFHRLNYAERRMAMFLAFSATTTPADFTMANSMREKSPFLSGLRLLTRDKDRPLLRQIVSYL